MGLLISLAKPHREGQKKTVTHFPKNAQLSASLSEISAVKFQAALQPPQETKNPFLLTNAHSSKIMHSTTILFNVITLPVLSANMKARYS
jgi:hypothetical protein